MRSRAATNMHIIGRKAFWGLLFVLIALISLYLYFISALIVNVVIREEVEIEIAETNSLIGELESQYVNQRNNIDLAYAQSIGFVLVKDKQFVTRTTLAGRGLTVRE